MKGGDAYDCIKNHRRVASAAMIRSQALPIVIPECFYQESYFQHLDSLMHRGMTLLRNFPISTIPPGRDRYARPMA